MGRRFFLTSILFIFSLINASTATAVTTPSFPSCSSPQGTLKVQYDDGTHGIPGDMSEHRGSDSIYSLTDTTLTQCFCAEDGQGIQTNWWQAATLSETEIDGLKRQGWTYIPNGALWGLSEAPYLTFNLDYFCGEGEGRGGGEVLGLATTGNIATIYTIAGLGLISLLTGVLLRR